jgi:metallo-beta-lactamase family protein
MKLTFYGSAQTVTGSRILFDHHHYRGMVDCGLFQGPKDLRLKNWNFDREYLNLQSLILTHAHIDHSGFAPKLFREGYRKNIFCSQPTSDLLPIMWMDAAKLQEEDANYANKSRYSHHYPALPLFESKDAVGAKNLLTPLRWYEWRNLSNFLGFRFHRAGHILGAARIEMSFSSDEKGPQIITFSGDVGSYHSDLQRPPDPLLETDYLVLESTYGKRKLDRSQVRLQLKEAINKVLGREGTLIIPAFSVGRTQEIVYLIHQLKSTNEINEDIPLYVDSPMSHEVTRIYLKNIAELKDSTLSPELSNSLAKIAFRPVLSSDESMLLCMSDEPKIVITASGMIQGGRILHHLKAKLPHAKNGVLFMGFQSAGTKGRILKEGTRTLRIHHQEIDVEADVISIDGLSAHADSDELIEWIRHCVRPPKKVFINHGEIDSAKFLQNRIQTELGWKDVIIPEEGVPYNCD